jgi:Peptidase family M1 domain/Secretion system C-terminal sorting domain/Peptidase M1 N-terminal domain
MKKIISILIFLLTVIVSNAQKINRANNSRSDSADITNYKLVINDINKTTKTIQALAEITIKSKINNLQKIDLDLEGLTVDSVCINNVITNFTQTISCVTIPFITGLQIGDSAVIKIKYGGTPITDATWGGFYFSGVYAFNMGVGFNSQPHVIGRYLFPCFDNFVERCPFEFFITTDAMDVASCNGLLIDSIHTGNKIRWHWKLVEPIPSYLVSVAVAPYTFVKSNLNGIAGTTESWIACLPSDTNKVKGSFANLQKSFTMLESHFGKYQWPKVGYSLVPFGAGAMEHAANIHIGLSFIDGTLNYETLIAHELSHHWFGDLATCTTAQDMWLNEGFASYCEMLHTEFVYGKNAYQTAYKTNHFEMLSSAHIADKGYRAVANMDSNFTYSTTVYNKGADMIHTLRSYLGDSLFFAGFNTFLSQNSFKHVSTNTLNQSLNANTGILLNNYFADWINQPGFANFCIDSTSKININGQWQVTVYTRQRKHFNPNYYSNVLLPISFYKSDFTHISIHTNFDQQCKVFTFLLPFDPAFICIDEDEKISDASTANSITVKTLGTKTAKEAKANIIIRSLTTDSAFVRIEHHWVAPDRFKNKVGDYVLHNNRHWQVDGIHLNNITGLIGFTYNANASNNYIDSVWLKAAETGIRLFYRKDAREDWKLAADSLVSGNTTDKIGIIYAKNIIAGQYALGINRPGFIDTITTDAPAGICNNIATNITENDEKLNNNIFTIYPNPASNFINIIANQLQSSATEIVLLDVNGNVILRDTLLANQRQLFIPIAIANGIYILQCKQQHSTLQSQKITIQ